MCRLRNIAMRDYLESVTTGQTDRCRTKRSLCAAMLRRRHNNQLCFTGKTNQYYISGIDDGDSSLPDPSLQQDYAGLVY